MSREIAKIKKELPDIARVKREIERASDPAEVLEIEARLTSIETYMRDAGLYTPDEIRPVNETRMRARWRLGQLLAMVERQRVTGPGRGKVGGKTV
jgi:hypothetical protein